MANISVRNLNIELLKFLLKLWWRQRNIIAAILIEHVLLIYIWIFYKNIGTSLILFSSIYILIGLLFKLDRTEGTVIFYKVCGINPYTAYNTKLIIFCLVVICHLIMVLIATNNFSSGIMLRAIILVGANYIIVSLSFFIKNKILKICTIVIINSLSYFTVLELKPYVFCLASILIYIYWRVLKNEAYH